MTKQLLPIGSRGVGRWLSHGCCTYGTLGSRRRIGNHVVSRSHPTLERITMQLFNWLSVFALALLASASEVPTELQIDTTYLPDSCTTKAAKGDAIKVHYVSTVQDTCISRSADNSGM